jgi:hypothetical protein
MPAAYLNGERIVNAVDKQMLEDAFEEHLNSKP